MSTQLFFLEKAVDVTAAHFQTGDIGSQVAAWLNLRGGQTGWQEAYLRTSRGPGPAITVTKATAAGPVAGIEYVSGIDLHWVTPPLAAAITISGTITVNLWGLENNMSANAAINVIIERLDSNGDIVSTVVKTAFATELNTVAAVNNFTATPTSTSFNKGDRIRIRVFAIDGGGTMGAGFTTSFVHSGATAAASGDSYVTFTENITFGIWPPGGTKIWLNDVTSPVVVASTVCKEAGFAAGASAATAVRNTVAGWTAPLEITDTAGGTIIQWYSKPLAAVTITKAAYLLLYSSISVAQSTQHRLEIARVDNDGTNPLVWGTGGVKVFNTAAQTADVLISGSDLVLTNGQRLRFRFFIDDSASSGGPLVTGRTMTLHYNGAGVGESYIEFGDTLTEYVAAAAVPYRSPYPQLLAQ